MYELAIDHQRSGLSLSVHPDRGDAADALAAYSSTAECFPRIIQMTDPYSSYELVNTAWRPRHRHRDHRAPRRRPDRRKAFRGSQSCARRQPGGRERR